MREKEAFRLRQQEQHERVMDRWITAHYAMEMTIKSVRGIKTIAR
jgi:hypothetical protein